MARLPRLTLPDQLHHVMQLGNNHQSVFRSSLDYLRCLQLLGEQARALHIDIHAYVLLPSQFNVLATPREDNHGVATMMQALGRSYVRYFNDAHGRSGTLWDGRYRSTLVDANEHGLTSMIYMDMEPVRMGLVAQAADYPWSSHAHYAGRRSDSIVTPPDFVWKLGNTPFAREAAYVAVVQTGLAGSDHRTISSAMTRGWAFGSDAYLADIQKKTDRRVKPGRPGRPSNRAALLPSDKNPA